MPSIPITKNEKTCTITLQGNLTALRIGIIQQTLKQELQQLPPALIIDLREVGMIDSSAIGMLIATANTVHKYGGALKVINLSPENYRLFESMRIAKRLNATENSGMER